VEKKVPLLLSYLFGEAAAAALQGAAERLRVWACAFEAWLEERLRSFNRVAVRQSRQAWQRLLGQTRKLPWELSQADIEGHLAWLKDEGYSPFTIYYTRYINDFYKWCEAQRVDPECPPGFNPAEGVRRPYPGVYAGRELLSRGEVQRLLETLGRDEAPIGRRNHAFILARLRLGVPSRYIQKLQWGQIEVGEDGAQVRWREGGEAMDLPEEVWEAMRGYLWAAGRLGGMQPEAYVFATLGKPTRQTIGERASDWQEERAIALQEVWRSLKRYGGPAKIPEEKLKLEGLRLTAIRMKLEEGGSLEGMRIFMDSHSSPRLLQYRLEDLPGLPPDEQEESASSLAGFIPSHKQFIYQPGEGLKHGWYATSQPGLEVEAVLAENIQGIEEAFAGLRLLARGLLGTADPGERRQRNGPPGRDAQGRAAQEAGEAGRP
jgi:hypothetical protein